MKRVDQIFELPVDEMDVLEAVDNFSEEKDEAIVRAINHVDALADVLEALLKELDLTYIHCSNLSELEHKASVVLAEYRGDK